MQEAIDDRLSFRRFLGLGLDDPGVDHATIALFRQRLHEAGLTSTLFGQANRHLLSQGLIVKKGTAVDATVLEAPKGRAREQSFTRSHWGQLQGHSKAIQTPS